MKSAQMAQVKGITDGKQLYIAFELSNKSWKLAMSNGLKIRHKSIAARDLEACLQQVQIAKSRFGLPEDSPVFSCYEAGRDGFWIHRFLSDQGITNYVVDSASIEVDRRFRRAKTDRLDVGKLLSMLMRYVGGERKLWSVLRVPSVQEEDDRRIDREIQRLKKERASHSNRMRSLLVLQGITIGKINKQFAGVLERVRLYDGQPLPSGIKEEIMREYERYELIDVHLKQLEQRKKQILDSASRQAKQVLKLRQLRGIGDVGSWDLTFEFFGWRRFGNVKQVGGASGLAPTPWASGSRQIEQGISKAGNARVRKLMIELSWLWLRYQPQSSLSRWYRQRFGTGGKRMRRVGIVALARKLLVALWKYLDKGLVPEGAALKP
jgi:transposase